MISMEMLVAAFLVLFTVAASLVFLALLRQMILYSFLDFIIILFLGGSVYAKSNDGIVKKMISLLQAAPGLPMPGGQKAADLGSGDGRLLIALAKEGIEAHGYEINPFLVWLSRKNIKEAGLEGRTFVHWKNFWKEDMSKFNLVAIYCITTTMGKLEKKLRKELKPGAKVVSNYFVFPSWPHSKKENNIYLYIQK